MIVATVVLALLAAALFAVAWRRGDGTHRRGVAEGWRMLKSTLPLLLVAFAIVGFVTVLRRASWCRHGSAPSPAGADSWLPSSSACCCRAARTSCFR